MKNIVIVALLFAIFAVPAVPAVAAEGNNNVGVSYGFDLDGVVGIQGEFDISASMPNKAPVAIQVFWKNYAQSYPTGAGTYQWSYNAFGAAALYDFSSMVKLDSKIKPYAGLGLIALDSSLSGPTGQPPTGADSGGLYVVAGARYALTPTFSADLNLNNYGGLTIGALLNF